jgi:thiol-disulfide isomerase/thioredoxin
MVHLSEKWSNFAKGHRPKTELLLFHSGVPLRRMVSSLLLMILTWACLVCCCTSDDSALPAKTFLTKETFHAVTANKTVFIKWAATWCGHSQDLAPAWDRLVAANFDNEKADSESNDVVIPLLIAEVDCTKQADWCSEMGYTAYPTLTYGDASLNGRYLQTYQSLQKDYESLRDFVQSSLWNRSFCTPGNFLVDGRCSIEEKDRIQQYFDMPLAELQSSIESEEGSLQAAEDSFRRSTSAMKAQYDALSKGHEANKAKIKRQLQLMKRVLEQK